MIQLIDKSNYLKVVFVGQNKSEFGLKKAFEFTENNDGSFKLLKNGIEIADNKLYSDFSTDGVTPFASLAAFETFALANSGPNFSLGGVAPVDADLTCQLFYLEEDVPNATTTDIDLPGFVFTIPAGKGCVADMIMNFTSAAVSTGVNIGIKVSLPVGANGIVMGSMSGSSRLSASTDTDFYYAVNVIPNATVSYTGLSGVSTATLNGSTVCTKLKNTSTNADATCQIIFASEIAASAVTAKIGTSMDVFTK